MLGVRGGVCSHHALGSGLGLQACTGRLVGSPEAQSHAKLDPTLTFCLPFLASGICQVLLFGSFASDTGGCDLSSQCVQP